MSGAKELIYLYCVTDKKPQLKEESPPTPLVAKLLLSNAFPSWRLGTRKDGGIKDMYRVYFVYHQGLYAVVSKVIEEEFNKENLEKNLSDMGWLKVKVSMHEKIIEEVMIENCVIPFKFATLFNTEENLKACLDEHAEEFRKNLAYMEGKEEWGVKIYCNMNRLSNFLIKKNEEILATDNEICSSSPGKAFLFRKKRDGLINKMIDRMISMYIQDSLNNLSKHSLQIRINKCLPKDITEREEEMILNAAFLVRENNVDAFINTVDMIRVKYEENGLSLDCTGPWPPYNFCNFYKERVQIGEENA